MAISRYKTNGTKKSPDGRTVYKARRLKNIPKSNEDKYVVSQTGDRLDTLANEYYGSSAYWWIIATAKSDDASWVTGAILTVDGGESIK